MAVHFTENAVEAAPLPRERLQAANFGEGRAVAQGAEQLGQQLGNTAETVDRIHAMYDEAAAKQADADTLPQTAAIRAKYQNMAGFDAQGARDKAEQEITAVRETAMQKLKSPRAQKMFNEVFTRRSATDLAEIQAHELKQLGVARTNAAAARSDSYADLAVQNYDSPDFEDYVRTSNFELRTVMAGAGEDAINAKMRERTSGIYRRVALRLIDDPDKALEAQTWVDQHAKDMLPEDEHAARQAIRPHVEEAIDDAHIGMIEAEAAGGATEEHGRVRVNTAPAGPAERQARDQRAVANADPLNGRGGKPVPGGEYGASRDGGRRRHEGVDLPAPAGTPIRPPVSGRVIKNWYDPGGGWSVLIEHPDGKVSGYAHLRSQSPLDEDDTVTSKTVIGSVGATGASAHGNHLHWTARLSRNGPKVDPRTVHWAEGDIPPPPEQTAQREHPAAEGSDIPSFTPEHNDKAALYAAAHRVAVREHWSRAEYDRALKRVDQNVAREDNLYERAQADMSERVWSRIAEIGPDDIKSVSQLGSDFGRLPAKERVQVLNLIEQNNKPKQPEADGDTYLTYLQASGDPAQQNSFMRVDFRRVTGITRGVRAQFINMQNAMGKRDARDGEVKPTEIAANYSRVSTFADRYAFAAGYNVQKADKEIRDGRPGEHTRLRVALNMAMRTEYERQSAYLKRALTDDEMDAIARRETMKYRLAGRNGQVLGQPELPRFLARDAARHLGAVGQVNVDDAMSKIPEATRNAISARLEHELGIPPTAAQIVNVYLEMGR